MKKTSLKTLLGVILSGAMIMLAACDQGNKNTTRASAPVRVLTPTGLGVNTVNCTATGQSSKGRIFDQSYSGMFENNVKDFVSATLNPAELGSIDGSAYGNTGVIFQMTLKSSTAGQIALDQSSAKISIYDSYVGQLDSNGQQIRPYDISFDKASAGNFTNAGNSTVTFKDQFGEVTFTGTLNSSSFTGTVTFKNYTSWDGGGGVTGTLGTFQIARCAIGL